jgi:AcrR family transcriptional regulator
VNALSNGRCAAPGHAPELHNETARTDFTVQEIVERSGMSLRAFYQHFGSKDELLLALFEEAIRAYITQLRADVERHSDPAARLETLVAGLFRAVELSAAPGTRALTLYHLQLAEAHPNEFAHALAPQMDLVLEIVEAGVAEGRFRTDIEAPRLAMMVMQCLVSSIQMNVLGIHLTGVEVTADQLSAFCVAALKSPDGKRGLRRGSRGTAQ